MDQLQLIHVITLFKTIKIEYLHVYQVLANEREDFESI